MASQQQVIPGAAEPAQSEADYAGRDAQRHQREAELRQLASQLAERETQLDGNLDQLDQREKQLAEQQDEIRRRAAELDRLQAELAAQQEQVEKILRAKVKSGKPSDAAANELAGEDEGVEPKRSAASMETAEQPSDGGEQSKADSSEEDIFARLRAMSILKDDPEGRSTDDADAAADESASQADESGADYEQSAGAAEECDAGQGQSGEEEPTGESRNEASTEPARQRADDEQSINDYMSRLLAKYGNKAEDGTTVAASQAPPVQIRQSATSQAATSEAALEQAKSETAARPAMTKLEPPRTAAPEKSGSLAAMREIANFSTREAIATHHRHRSIIILSSKVAVGVFGLICGALLLHWDDGQSWIYFGGLAGLIVAGYWFVRAGHMARSLQKFRRKAENPMAATSHAQRSLPPVNDGGLDLTDQPADAEKSEQSA